MILYRTYKNVAVVAPKLVYKIKVKFSSPNPSTELSTPAFLQRNCISFAWSQVSFSYNVTYCLAKSSTVTFTN